MARQVVLVKLIIRLCLFQMKIFVLRIHAKMEARASGLVATSTVNVAQDLLDDTVKTVSLVSDF